MAFHVACPITCRRICFCSLGFPRSLHTAKAKNGFLDDVSLLQEFLEDPSRIRVSADSSHNVQVAVPKLVQPLPPPSGQLQSSVVGDAVDEAASMQAKRVALQRKGAAAMIAAEEYARRLESGDVLDASGNITGEEKGQTNVKVFCRMCNCVENEGSEREKKMLSCKSCGKKYHRNCLRSWAQHRDLFHWSSWTCRACRICEACKRTGDPSKFMFCKRCDGAYHCYCLQPPHKNISAGPYLCPKHTRCHSCGSNVPGNGLSLRWFLGYTCCDACGRLFVKGNYCPVCLKVYRDSESTPMVCCDICQRWVHCHCDNISDEKYHQFQVDGNLQYKCPTCRGECYKVKDLEDAVQELWRRKDMADRDLIASLRAAAGLPTQEEIFSISPYSDDEDSGPIKAKSEPGRSFKFSFKKLSDNSPKKIKDYGKKSSSKKYAKKRDYQSIMSGKTVPHKNYEGQSDVNYLHSFDDDKNDDIQSQTIDSSVVHSSPAAGDPGNQQGILKHKFVDEVTLSDEERKPSVVRIKSNKVHGVDSEEDTGKHVDKTQNVKGRKLIINLGTRKFNVTNSPQSDALSCQKDQDLVTPNGNRVDACRSKVSKVFRRERNLIKLGKVKPEVSGTYDRVNISDGCEALPVEQPRIFLEKHSSEEIVDQIGYVEAISSGERTSFGKPSERRSGSYDEIDDNNNQMSSHSLLKDSKPLLRFKLKKPSIEHQNSSIWEEKITTKGLRSKRKRPSPFMKKASVNADEDVSQAHQNTGIHEFMDANWILMKLGKDAIGKRVEVHQTSDNSWHKGVVSDIIEGTSKLSVSLDDGSMEILDLRKQGVRFVPQKKKRSKA